MLCSNDCRGWQPNSPHWCLGSWLNLLISNIYRELITLLCFWTLGKLLPIIHSVFSWWLSTHEGNIWLFSRSMFHCVHQPASNCVSLLFGVEREVYSGIIAQMRNRGTNIVPFFPGTLLSQLLYPETTWLLIKISYPFVSGQSCHFFLYKSYCSL